jgi:hypothetical protein
MDIKAILAAAAFSVGKEIVKNLAKSKADNVAVRPQAGGELVGADGAKVVAALKEQFKDKQFLWLSKPFDVAQGKPEGGAQGKPGGKLEGAEKPEGAKPEGV